MCWQLRWQEGARDRWVVLPGCDVATWGRPLLPDSRSHRSQKCPPFGGGMPGMLMHILSTVHSTQLPVAVCRAKRARSPSRGATDSLGCSGGLYVPLWYLYFQIDSIQILIEANKRQIFLPNGIWDTNVFTITRSQYKQKAISEIQNINIWDTNVFKGKYEIFFQNFKDKRQNINTDLSNWEREY